MKGLVRGYAAKWMNQDLNPESCGLSSWSSLHCTERAGAGEASYGDALVRLPWHWRWDMMNEGLGGGSRAGRTQETSQGSVDGTWREGEGGNCHSSTLIFLKTLLLPSLLRLSANAFLMSWIFFVFNQTAWSNEEDSGPRRERLRF